LKTESFGVINVIDFVAARFVSSFFSQHADQLKTKVVILLNVENVIGNAIYESCLGLVPGFCWNPIPGVSDALPARQDCQKRNA
jgi:hypothetical protein